LRYSDRTAYFAEFGNEWSYDECCFTFYAIWGTAIALERVIMTCCREMKKHDQIKRLIDDKNQKKFDEYHKE